MGLLKKIAVGTSALAFAAVLSAGAFAAPASAEEPAVSAAPAPTVSASPAPTAPAIADDITINYKKQTLTVSKTSGDKKISVSFLTVKKNSTEITGEKNICTYDMGSNTKSEDGKITGFTTADVTVDLSTLSVTTDNYIKVWGDVNKEPVVIKIPAAESLSKGNVDVKETNSITVLKKDKSEYIGRVEYAIGTDSWDKVVEQGSKEANVVTKYDIGNLSALGATLRARVEGGIAVTTGDGAGWKDSYTITASDVFKDYTVKKTKENIKTYELTGTFPGKEIKIKVPKMSSAPKVKVDYTKGTLTLPNNAEYRVNTTGSNANLGDWTDGSKKVFTTTAGTDAAPSEFDITKGGNIDVRIKATATKPASMYLAFAYDRQAVLTVQKANGTADAASDTAKAEVGSKPEGEAAFTADLTLDYTRTKAVLNTKGKVRTATSGAIKVSNNNENYTYQVVVVSKSEGAPKADYKKSVKTVKKGRDITIKVNNKEDYEVYVRRAAVTTGTVAWATDWVNVLSLTKDNLAPTVVVGGASTPAATPAASPTA